MLYVFFFLLWNLFSWSYMDCCCFHSVAPQRHQKASWCHSESRLSCQLGRRLTVGWCYWRYWCYWWAWSPHRLHRALPGELWRWVYRRIRPKQLESGTWLCSRCQLKSGQDPVCLHHILQLITSQSVYSSWCNPHECHGNSNTLNGGWWTGCCLDTWWKLSTGKHQRRPTLLCTALFQAAVSACMPVLRGVCSREAAVT